MRAVDTAIARPRTHASRVATLTAQRGCVRQPLDRGRTRPAPPDVRMRPPVRGRPPRPARAFDIRVHGLVAVDAGGSERPARRAVAAGGQPATTEQAGPPAVLGSPHSARPRRTTPTRRPSSARRSRTHPPTRTSSTAPPARASARPPAPSPPSSSPRTRRDPENAKTRAQHGTHPDLTWVTPSGAHEMLRSDVDEAVVSAAAHTPFEASHRVFVLERVDVMNDETANCAPQDARGASRLRRADPAHGPAVAGAADDREPLPARPLRRADDRPARRNGCSSRASRRRPHRPRRG